MAKQRMSMRHAMDLVPDDLPDGAFWAMAHEMAGLDYGDGFDELAAEREPVCRDEQVRLKTAKKIECGSGCNRRFRTEQAARDHRRDKHGIR